MKTIKRFLVCFVALSLLCNNFMLHACAEEKGVKSASFIVEQEANWGGATVTFYFSYSDGNSATLAGAFLTGGGENYSLPYSPTSDFYGDTCYATVVVKNDNTNQTTTLRARCDIYGDTSVY
jgi:hypothetical protein